MPGRDHPKRDGGKGGLPREVLVSKKMSKLLRHSARQEGLEMSEEGFVNLAAALASNSLRGLKVTFAEVQELVKDSDKQRFALKLDSSTFPAQDGDSTSTDPKDWLIRANQGHSIKFESDAGLLTSITKDNIPTEAVHGTTHANWVLIAASGGLKPMARNHVHFASGLPAGFKSVTEGIDTNDPKAAPVISGMRSTSTILIFLDVEKALDSGIKLGLSQNGVILSEGNDSGLIPLSVLKRVEDRTGEGILLQDGEILKEAPASWAKRAPKR